MKHRRIGSLVISLFILLASLGFPSTIQAQDSDPSSLVLTLSAPGDSLSLENVPVVAALLPDDFVPFNEFCHLEWTPTFESLLARQKVQPHPIFGSLPTTSIQATTDASGSATLTLPSNQRFGLAVKFDGVWWPVTNEVFLEKGSQEVVALHVYPVTRATEEVSIDIHQMAFVPRESTVEEWVTLDVADSIEITNHSLTQAWCPPTGESAIRIPLPPPFGKDKTTVLHPALKVSWTHLSDIIRNAETPNERSDPSEDLANCSPYRPWSSGASWGKAGGHSVHDAETETTNRYEREGAKYAPLRTHPLFVESVSELAGAGDIQIVEEEDFFSLVLLKVIPPNSTLRFRVKYYQHDLKSLKQREIERMPLPLPCQSMGLFSSGGLQLSGTGELHAILGPDQYGEIQQRLVNEDGTPLIPANAKYGVTVFIPDQLVYGPQQSNTNDAEFQLPMDLPESGESKLIFQNVAIFLAIVFGLLFIAALIYNLRPDEEKQSHGLFNSQATEDAIVQELHSLKEDFDKGKISPVVYQRERKIIIQSYTGNIRLPDFETQDDESKS